jgi:hypothetical protein
MDCCERWLARANGADEMKKTMKATINHETKNTYRIAYEIKDEETCGSCLTRGATLDAAKENFRNHYRAKKYQIEWIH